MLKRLWLWFIRTPPGLDWVERIYVYGQYTICVMFALSGLLFVVGAVVSNTGVLPRITMLVVACTFIALALGFRILVFWVYAKKAQLMKFLGL